MPTSRRRPPDARAPRASPPCDRLARRTMASTIAATTCSSSASVFSTRIQRSGSPRGQRAVAGAQPQLKAAAGQPLARDRPAIGREDLGHLAPPARHRRIDVDQEDQIGPEPAGGRGEHRARSLRREIAPRLRQHLGGVEVAIGDDHVGPRQRRAAAPRRPAGPRAPRRASARPAARAPCCARRGRSREFPASPWRRTPPPRADARPRARARAAPWRPGSRWSSFRCRRSPRRRRTSFSTSRGDEGPEGKRRRLRRGGRGAGRRRRARRRRGRARSSPCWNLEKRVRRLQRLQRRAEPERHLAAVLDLQDARRKGGDHLARARRRRVARLADRLRPTERQVLVERDANAASFGGQTEAPVPGREARGHRGKRQLARDRRQGARRARRPCPSSAALVDQARDLGGRGGRGAPCCGASPSCSLSSMNATPERTGASFGVAATAYSRTRSRRAGSPSPERK